MQIVEATRRQGGSGGGGWLSWPYPVGEWRVAAQRWIFSPHSNRLGRTHKATGYRWFSSTSRGRKAHFLSQPRVVGMPKSQTDQRCNFQLCGCWENVTTLWFLHVIFHKCACWHDSNVFRNFTNSNYRISRSPTHKSMCVNYFFNLLQHLFGKPPLAARDYFTMILHDLHTWFWGISSHYSLGC